MQSMRTRYHAPTLHVYGSMEQLTGADFQSSASDGIFLDQTQVGEATGSLDACVFGSGPPPPGANCNG